MRNKRAEYMVMDFLHGFYGQPAKSNFQLKFNCSNTGNYAVCAVLRGILVLMDDLGELNFEFDGNDLWDCYNNTHFLP